VVVLASLISSLDKVVQSDAASSEESASAGQELTSQARELNQQISMLVSFVTGTQPAALESAPVASPEETKLRRPLKAAATVGSKRPLPAAAKQTAMALSMAEF